MTRQEHLFGGISNSANRVLYITPTGFVVVLFLLPTVETVGYEYQSQKNLPLTPTFRSGEA